MNYKMIFHILGSILKAEACLMLPSALVATVYGESCLGAFAAAILLALAAGVLLSWKRPADSVIFAREGFIVVGLAWVVMSLVGALPFYLSGEIPSFCDSFFETVSGFTTTGASILTEVEHLPRGLLFWRSFTHWIGGMGVLVFVLTILPLAGERSMHLLRAEVPGPSVGKLVPKMRSTAIILYSIYLALTVLEVILLVAGGMPLFDSLVNSFATAGTGGFSIRNASIAAYGSAYADGVIGVFMLLFGVNFNLYYFLLIGNFSAVWRSEELRCYLGIVGLSVAAITLNTLSSYGRLSTAFRYAFFQVSSIITTTGFATADFDKWPALSRCILAALMVLGACGGSTGGGIKVSRLVIAVKSTLAECRRMLHPRSVEIVKMDGKAVSESTVAGVHIFLAAYCFVLAGSVLLVAFDNFDFTTTFTSVLACLGNIGPGLGAVGPMGNFSGFSVFSKLILSADMLLGRLEIFPMIMLFFPSVWRKR